MNAREKADFLVSLANQVVNAHAHGTVAGNVHRVVGCTGQLSVNEHYGEALGNGGGELPEVRHGGGDDQPVHQSAGEHVQTIQLPLRILPGVQNQKPVSLLSQNVLHLFNHGGEKGVGYIRHHKGNQVALAGFEAAGGGIRHIMQLLNGSFYRQPSRLIDVPGPVDHVAHCSNGHPCPCRHISDTDIFHRHSVKRLNEWIFC